MEITKYLQHLPSCNKLQDWSEAQEALAYCPDGSDKDTAYTELQVLMMSCSCGVNEALARFAGSWYAKGWIDSGESGTEEELRATFDEKYSSLIHPI